MPSNDRENIGLPNGPRKLAPDVLEVHTNDADRGGETGTALQSQLDDAL